MFHENYEVWKGPYGNPDYDQKKIERLASSEIQYQELMEKVQPQDCSFGGRMPYERQVARFALALVHDYLSIGLYETDNGARRIRDELANLSIRFPDSNELNKAFREIKNLIDAQIEKYKAQIRLIEEVMEEGKRRRPS